MMRTNLLAVAISVLAIAASPSLAAAEPGGFTPQDETYYRLLNTPDDEGTVLNVTNFPLLRAQGLMVCRLIDSGVDDLDAIHRLMEEGPYSFDTANFISASAKVAYCKDNLLQE